MHWSIVDCTVPVCQCSYNSHGALRITKYLEYLNTLTIKVGDISTPPPHDFWVPKKSCFSFLFVCLFVFACLLVREIGDVRGYIPYPGAASGGWQGEIPPPPHEFASCFCFVCLFVLACQLNHVRDDDNTPTPLWTFCHFASLSPAPPPPSVLFRVRVCLFSPFEGTPPISGQPKFLNTPFAGFSQAIPALETPLNPEHCSKLAGISEFEPGI